MSSNQKNLIREVSRAWLKQFLHWKEELRDNWNHEEKSFDDERRFSYFLDCWKVKWAVDLLNIYEGHATRKDIEDLLGDFSLDKVRRILKWWKDGLGGLYLKECKPSDLGLKDYEKDDDRKFKHSKELRGKKNRPSPSKGPKPFLYPSKNPDLSLFSLVAGFLLGVAGELDEESERVLLEIANAHAESLLVDWDEFTEFKSEVNGYLNAIIHDPMIDYIAGKVIESLIEVGKKALEKDIPSTDGERKRLKEMINHNKQTIENLENI